MGIHCRGMIMIVASILLATTTVLASSSSATVESAAVANSNATSPGTPPPPVPLPRCRRGTMEPKVAAKCWIAILEVPLCVFQIVKAFEGGSVFSIGKACCHAFIDLTDDCKIEVFQKSEFFPAIEKFCAAIGGDGGSANTTTTAAGLGN
ncbi:unnamed protein product [Linum tenue]|uniref:Prolamin-like domain-containing protein n=1 Tax=Linum tenue TaxID=586396 RepID=A0AAV0N196_9ROSI|nr:unnamed protein product [Linum tenue]